MDYLVEEVLRHQPEDMRNFLLQTSILNELSGPLCDAVTGQKDGQRMLEAVDRGNLLVVALDNRRHWYRYHQLFADVLQARSMLEQPDLIPVLHCRASQWYEEQWVDGRCYPSCACRQRFRADGRPGRTGMANSDMGVSRTPPGWAGSKEVPEGLIRNRPVLSVDYRLDSAKSG